MYSSHASVALYVVLIIINIYELVFLNDDQMIIPKKEMEDPALRTYDI